MVLFNPGKLIAKGEFSFQSPLRKKMVLELHEDSVSLSNEKERNLVLELANLKSVIIPSPTKGFTVVLIPEKDVLESTIIINFDENNTKLLKDLTGKTLLDKFTNFFDKNTRLIQPNPLVFSSLKKKSFVECYQKTRQG
jgi:hypothetical protein